MNQPQNWELFGANNDSPISASEELMSHKYTATSVRPGPDEVIHRTDDVSTTGIDDKVRRFRQRPGAGR